MTEKITGTKTWCPFYRGVRLIWVSVLRGLTVCVDGPIWTSFTRWRNKKNSLQFLSRLWHITNKSKGNEERTKQRTKPNSHMKFAIAHALLTMFTEKSWILEWIRIRADGQTNIGPVAVSSSEEEESLLISISSFACIKNKNTALKGLQ